MKKHRNQSIFPLDSIRVLHIVIIQQEHCIERTNVICSARIPNFSVFPLQVFQTNDFASLAEWPRLSDVLIDNYMQHVLNKHGITV